MAVLTTRKQTYPFKTIGIGEQFKVSKAKYNSMLTAYRQHNKKHPELAITIEAAATGSGYLVTRLT